MATKPQQPFLSEEMTPKTIKEIEDAAEELHAIRTERIALNRKEEEAQELLIRVMEKHELTVYKLGPLIATLEPGKTKAKVKEVASKEGPGDGDGDDKDTEGDTRRLTVREVALAGSGRLDPLAPHAGQVVRFDGSVFDIMVVGEIVEEFNQSLDWFHSLAPAKQKALYDRQLAKPPRRQAASGQ